MTLVWTQDGREEPAWSLSKEKIYDFSDGQMRPLWKEAADHIRSEVGSDDLDAVIAHYCGVFGLPPVTLITPKEARERFRGMPTAARKSGEMSYTLMQAIKTTDGRGGNVRYYISHNPASQMMSPDQELVVLMHEIEHIRDMVDGYDGGPEHPVEYDRKAREYRILPGHHRDYALFDYEWPHRLVIGRALENGEAVPEDVLAGYPDLAERASELAAAKGFRR